MGTFAQAQEGHFKLGVHAGLPIGDAGDSFSFNAGVDAAYLWSLTDEVELGITTGYSNYFGKTYTFNSGLGPISIDGGDLGIIPVAATGQYNFDGGFNIGADLGYAFYVSDGSEGGGFYYQPKVGYTFSENSSAFVGYKGVSDDGSTLSSINLGYAYKF